MGNRFQEEIAAALAAVEREDATPIERVEMLVEIAMGLQHKPKSPEQLLGAVDLYRKALEICPEGETLLAARTTARMATALQAVPSDDPAFLDEARRALEGARPVLETEGTAEEVAEVDMNLGLVLQGLAGLGRARITDAISAHQRALRVFRSTTHPKEFAILQNNLATAFLSVPMTDERAAMREALAVSSFEEGLKVVNLVDHPAEYAMLQNNLGNALQYASSSHAVENNLRALEAYDEALRVRTRRDMPVAHANTLANKANCLANLPDDPERPEAGNPENLAEARRLLREAAAIFEEHGDLGKAALVAEALAGIEVH
ncbi:MAG: hypothetical protein KDD11_13120 [Acidobacteria bacterium]|nr:hypothetical protein [Acidobacteriota bacterium]